jgi:hypothetical protein
MGSRSGSKVSISAKQALALLCLASACGEAEQRAPKQATLKVQPSRATVPPPAPAPLDAEEPASGAEAGAAYVLKRYYALIGARRYEPAQRLRESSARAPNAGEFAANFERYAEHHATVGTPSMVAEAGEWLYVEVPVQRYGKFQNGKTFVNAGTVTLRRRKSGGEWRIFTSG